MSCNFSYRFFASVVIILFLGLCGKEKHSYSYSYSDPVKLKKKIKSCKKFRNLSFGKI